MWSYSISPREKMQDSASGGDSARQFVGADGERSRQRRRSATDAAYPLRVHIGPANIWHHRHIRRWPVISTAGCFALSLRGNCFRWERCPHAGGAVVQLCREISVCWPQCFSTGSFCGTAVQSDSHPAPLFSPFFSGKTEKNGPAERQLRCHRINGSPVKPDKRTARGPAANSRRQFSITCPPVTGIA